MPDGWWKYQTIQVPNACTGNPKNPVITTSILRFTMPTEGKKKIPYTNFQLDGGNSRLYTLQNACIGDHKTQWRICFLALPYPWVVRQQSCYILRREKGYALKWINRMRSNLWLKDWPTLQALKKNIRSVYNLLIFSNSWESII